MRGRGGINMTMVQYQIGCVENVQEKLSYMSAIGVYDDCQDIYLKF